MQWSCLGAQRWKTLLCCHQHGADKLFDPVCKDRHDVRIVMKDGGIARVRQMCHG